MDLTKRAKNMMAFITPQDRTFKWRVMPFGISNALPLFEEMMSQVLCLVKNRPAAEELSTRGAVLEAHIDNVLLRGQFGQRPFSTLEGVLSGLSGATLEENAGEVRVPQKRNGVTWIYDWTRIVEANGREAATIARLRPVRSQWES